MKFVLRGSAPVGVPRILRSRYPVCSAVTRATVNVRGLISGGSSL